MGQLKDQLQRDIEKITSGQSIPIEEIIQKLKQMRKYQRTKESSLKMIIKEIQQKQNSLSTKGIVPNEKKIFDDCVEVFFSNLAGIDGIQEDIQWFIDINIFQQEMFRNLGFDRSKKNILIKGPQGSGKTSLAYAIANYTERPYIKMNMYDKWIYSNISNDQKFLNFIQNLKIEKMPCVIILDDFCRIFSKQQNKTSKSNTVQQLFDIFEEIRDSDIMIIAIIEQVKNFPTELLREGRLEKVINLGIPTELQWQSILDLKLKNIHTASDIDTFTISQMIPGFVGSDISNLLLSAGERSVKRFMEQKQELILTQQDIIESIPFINPIIKREGFNTIPDVTFKDIGALKNIKKELQDIILKPLQDPEKCWKFNIKKQAGILLYGPPGCGKTMLAKAVANACKANFIYVKGPELLSKYFGESEKTVWELFERARLSAPCLIFFDEIDGLCPKRSTEGNQVIERVVNQLLTEMNGLDDMEHIYLIGATNRPDIIDWAILRPERLGIHLYVPVPSKQDRIDILKTLMRDRPIGEDVVVDDFNNIFDLKRFSGADLKSFVEGAARNAAWNGKDSEFIEKQDFQVSINKCKASILEKDLQYYQELRKKFN